MNGSEAPGLPMIAIAQPTWRSTLRKWRAIFNVYVQDGLAYRASGLIWVTTDVVTAVTMPLVWAAASQGGAIRGFAASDFVLYYLCILLLSGFVTSHIMWEIAMEIREGQFSTNLVRPISFAQYTFFRNLSWRLIRPLLFLPFFLLLVVAYQGHLVDVRLHPSPEFWASLVLGHLVSFNFVFTMAMLALFLQEAQSVFELYYLPMLFLSGQLFPVALLPAWARALAHLFPFYYTTAVPTEILTGRLVGPAVSTAIIGQLVWVVFLYGLGRVFWRYGLRHYTGIGM
ncbi:MAG: ABC-2 family transporter protein [Fimbriimonadaceae bacterium]|nr:ABC-2 family transporter protein [Fimbriimonadaceae bacterium]